MGLMEDTFMITREIPIITAEDMVTGCCAQFHPGQWEERIFDFSDYKFIQGHTTNLLYVPLNMDKVMTKVHADISAANAAYEDRGLILSQDIGAFRSDHYFLVKKDVPGYKSEKIEGLYFCKIYDGPFKEMSNHMKDFDDYLRLKERKLTEVFAYYTTCPKCAKTYKHNYVALFAKVDTYFEP